MNDDDEDLKEGLKRSMEKPAKSKNDYLQKRKDDYLKPHGNEE